MHLLPSLENSSLLAIHHLVDDSGVLHSIKPDGTQNWVSATLGSDITSTAAITDQGNILVGVHTKLYALDSNGDVLWFSTMGLNNGSSVVKLMLNCLL